MRCLFFAALHGNPIAWQAGAIPDHAGAQDLLNRYYFILKASLPDPALEDRPAAEALDLILANLHLEVLRFDNPLLRQGAETLRLGHAGQPAALRHDLLQARSGLLAALAV